MRSRKLLAAAVTAAAIVPGAPLPGTGPETGCPGFAFAEVADELGLRFRHDSGARGEKHLPETMGSGLAWLDADGDGFWDLYVVQSGPFPPDGSAAAGNRLFRNLSGRGFEELRGSGAEHPGYGQGAVAADVDGDGDTDLYVTNYGPDALLLNGGDGTFSDGTASAGIDVPGWSSSAAFADADRDGDLDLYVTRYLELEPGGEPACTASGGSSRRYCDPSLFVGASDRYYRNQLGGEGAARFADATADAGLAGASGRGLGVLWSDLDGDLGPDLYVANDLTLNLLYQNVGAGGTFADRSLLSGTAVDRDGKPEAGMGIALGDVDGDLDPDLVVSNFDVETNTLYLNQGGLQFVDRSAASGLGVPSFNLLGFGITLDDFDGDGDLDLYVANGHIFERPSRENVSYAQPDLLLAGDGRGRFAPVLCAPAVAQPTVARGLALADADNDGDVDLAIQSNGGPLRLLRNDREAGPWLGLVLRGRPPNTEGVGARVVVTTSRGSQVRWVVAGESYQSSSDRRLRFALADAAERTEIEVTWPSGRRTRILDPPLDRYLALAEPPG